MVECSFCSSSKSQKYLYTVCQHFVCINCAALRAGQTLICCNRSTVLQQDVKEQLKVKKQMILNNLQKGYEYERTDMNRISFEQIEKKLNKISHLEDNNKIGKKVTNEQNRNAKTQIDEEKISTLISEFHSNRKSVQREKLGVQTKKYSAQKNKYQVQRQRFQVQLSTPIKLVSHMDEEWEQKQRQLNRHVAPTITLSKPSKFKAQSIKTEQPHFSQLQFKPLLQNKINQIKKEFNSIHEQLEKLQVNIIHQIKVYFEQYVKLIEKDISFELMNFQTILSQKDRLTNYLDQIEQKWNLIDIKHMIENQTDKIKRQINMTEKQKDIYGKDIRNDIKFDNSPNSLIVKKQNIERLKQPQESFKLNSPLVKSNLDANQSYFETLKLNSMREPQKDEQNNEMCQPATTNRNLDKIYRKLQESRTKLQERIHLHNQFMNKKYTKLTNY